MDTFATAFNRVAIAAETATGSNRKPSPAARPGMRPARASASSQGRFTPRRRAIRAEFRKCGRGVLLVTPLGWGAPVRHYPRLFRLFSDCLRSQARPMGVIAMPRLRS